MKYFSIIQVPRHQDNEQNNIYLELMHNGNKEKYLLLVGSVQVYLYEVIQEAAPSTPFIPFQQP